MQRAIRPRGSCMGRVLIGPERAGTDSHTLTQSAAWNTLVTGTKRWFFFPPREDGS